MTTDTEKDTEKSKAKSADKGEGGSIKIFPRRNFNFHTEKVPGGLVFCAAGAITTVPDDVEDEAQNPLFKALVESGDVKIVGDTKGHPVVPGAAPGPTGSPLHAPDDETKKLDEERAKAAGDEDELGPPVSSEEAGKIQKPVTPPQHQQQAAQPVKK